MFPNVNSSVGFNQYQKAKGYEQLYPPRPAEWVLTVHIAWGRGPTLFPKRQCFAIFLLLHYFYHEKMD